MELNRPFGAETDLTELTVYDSYNWFGPHFLQRVAILFWHHKILTWWRGLTWKGSSSGQGSYDEPNSNVEKSKESKEKYSKLNLPLKKHKHCNSIMSSELTENLKSISERVTSSDKVSLCSVTFLKTYQRMLKVNIPGSKRYAVR